MANEIGSQHFYSVMLLKVETNQVNDEYGTCIAVSYQVYEEKFHTLHVVNISNPHERRERSAVIFKRRWYALHLWWI
jgi:hypothetical protein